MEKEALPVSFNNHLLQDICHDNKQVGRERISLAKSIFALDPAARDAIEQDSCGAGA